MTEEKRYDAILDTDFVAKTNIIQADSGDVLADRVLEFPGYRFYCHQMMEQELDDHGTNAANIFICGLVYQT